jgi:D-beta-D-heptose 7-phosphate kinase/D-beta-D-heptose 1-phosphate adenosyltransferase
VAANVTALGGQALLGALVGGDAAAATLIGALCRVGVAADGLIVDPGRPTTAKTRVLVGGRQVARIDEETTLEATAALEESLLAWITRTVAAADACVLSDYQKGVVSARMAVAVIGACRQAGVPVIVDPKATDPAPYAGATLVKPNRPEAALLAGRPLQTLADVHAVGDPLLELLGGAAVLITLGAEGMALCRTGQAALLIRASARAVFDVTGAGDTVAAVLALALAAGAPLETAARLANAAAGLAVAQVGTATVRPHDLVGALEAEAESP